jgi:hypothetical protein
MMSQEEQFKTYLCDYYYQGQKWTIDIPATSLQDAQERLKAIHSGEIVGELKFRILAGTSVKINWLSRLITKYFK